MEAVLLVARLVLVGAFALAGASKLLDRSATRAALGDFGVPATFVRPAAAALPLLELAVAIGLLVDGPVAWWTALAATGLLVLFSAGVLHALLRGRRFDCRCFGSFLPAPIGGRLLARNAGLLLAAGMVLWSGPEATGGGVTDWLIGRSAGELAVLAAVVLLAMLLVVIQWRRRPMGGRHASPGFGSLITTAPATRLERPIGGLPMGTSAPTFALRDDGGRTVSLEELLRGNRPALLLFVDPGCAACRPLWPALRPWQDQLAVASPLVVISHGPVDRMADHFPADSRPVLVADVDGAVARAYAIQGNPSAVLVGADGVVAAPTAEGADAVQTLVEQLLDRAAAAPV